MIPDTPKPHCERYDDLIAGVATVAIAAVILCVLWLPAVVWPVVAVMLTAFCSLPASTRVRASHQRKPLP